MGVQTVKKMLVDEKCRELAYHFLQSFATADQYDAQELAERIQATVEEFCDVAFNVPAPPPDPRDPDYSRPGIFAHHNCSRCKDGAELSRCPTPDRPGNCGYPHARND